MIEDIEDYFDNGCGRCERFATPDCSTRRWADGLTTLRRLCLEAGLVETVSWGHPCYKRADRNIALIGAFRGDFRLSFFNAALMNDPDGVLEKPGPNTQHPNMIRFTDNSRAAEMAPVILSYLKEAIAYADAGAVAPKEKAEFELPDELRDALDGDPALAEAFHRLTPGRRRSYVIGLASAKSTATRRARIERFRDRIFAGKGVSER